jgi:hypothetical protein
VSDEKTLQEQLTEAEGRTSCGADEVPSWARKLGRGFVGLLVDNMSFVSTQHLTVRVDVHDEPIHEAGSRVFKTNNWATTRQPPAVVGRAYAINGHGGRKYKRGHVVCDVGAVRVNLRYVLLVEHLFPGCVWAAPSSARLAPVQAFVGDALVALVAGQEPGTMGAKVGDCA